MIDNNFIVQYLCTRIHCISLPDYNIHEYLKLDKLEAGIIDS